MEREIFAQYKETQNPEDAVEALDEEACDVLPARLPDREVDQFGDRGLAALDDVDRNNEKASAQSQKGAAEDDEENIEDFLLQPLFIEFFSPMLRFSSFISLTGKTGKKL